MTKKVVFFEDKNRFSEALKYFKLDSFKNKKVPLKLHMGEKNNKYYPKPALVEEIVSELKKREISPFLFDTTVAYYARRNTKQGYEKLAEDHGFTEKNVGCQVIIDDTGVKKTLENRDYMVADHLDESSCIFALSHVKGHNATGMGGAIKNFGMGGVTKETKRMIHHSSRPVYKKDECTYCGICAELCPFNALQVDKKEQMWNQDMDSCFGCGVCVNVCKNDALDFIDADLQYLLASSAKAVLDGKNVIYLNELKRISKGCDCDPNSGPLICPDIGYLLSDDPVAVDKASLDLINNVKKDVFIKENYIDPFLQIKYGEKLGLGSSSYSLRKI